MCGKTSHGAILDVLNACRGYRSATSNFFYCWQGCSICRKFEHALLRERVRCGWGRWGGGVLGCHFEFTPVYPCYCYPHFLRVHEIDRGTNNCWWDKERQRVHEPSTELNDNTNKYIKEYWSEETREIWKTTNTSRWVAVLALYIYVLCTFTTH